VDRLKNPYLRLPALAPVFPPPLIGAAGKNGDCGGAGKPETGRFGEKRGQTPKTENTRPRPKDRGEHTPFITLEP